MPNCTLTTRLSKHLTSLVIFGVIGLSLLPTAYSEIENSTSKVFRASAAYNETYTLPLELRGHWARTRFVQKTNAPQVFNTIEKGSWDIQQVDDLVMLRNPDTGAQAMATITDVQGLTTTLEITKHVSSNKWCKEQLTLTPQGGQLTGEQKKHCYRKGDNTPYFYAIAYVKGEKASWDDEGYDNPYNYLLLDMSTLLHSK